MKKFLCLLTVVNCLWTSLLAQHTATVDSLIRQHYQDDAPGIAMAIIQEGETVYHQQLGMANLEYDIPISEATVFQLASVSKQFTAYLALLLEQDGQLDMEEDICIYLPELKHLDHEITSIQLANHTHGLPNVDELTSVKGFGTSDRLWHSDIVDVALRIETFNFEPGTSYQYNNTGYVLLAEIIERQSGVPFQEALQQYIFEPLGMENTLVVGSPDQIVKNEAASYARRNDQYRKYDNNIMSNGSSGVRTTMGDLARWAKHLQATIGDDEIPFARMVQPSSLVNGEGLPYGLGLETRDYRGTLAVFHGGGTAGHRAYTLHIPEHQFSVLVLGNGNDYWSLKLAYEVVDLYLGDQLVTQAKLEMEPVKNEDLVPHEGTYVFHPGTYFRFTAKEDSLFWDVIGASGDFYLEPLGEDTFAYPFYPNARFIFHNGQVELHIADFVYVCPPAKPVLKTYTAEALTELTGFYYNEALHTTYEMIVEDGQLLADHPINYPIPLQGLADDSFFSMANFFGKIDFKRNTQGEVTGFSLSGQNMKGLWFERIER